MFAIARIEKLKDRASILKRSRHHLREAEVHNADPARRKQNGSNWKGTAEQLTDAIWGRVEPLVKRKDAVRCVELLLTASPEWFDQPGKDVQLAKAASEFAREMFGKQNVVGVGIHCDEKTPHVWVMVTPVHEGKLRASHWFDGPKKMSQFQDAWASKMEPFGLSRGVKGSPARHMDIKTYYSAVNGDPVAVEKMAREQARRLAWAKKKADEAMEAFESIKQLNAQSLELAKTVRNVKVQEETVKRAEAVQKALMNSKVNQAIEQAMKKRTIPGPGA